jgi:hypothetical protein
MKQDTTYSNPLILLTRTARKYYGIKFAVNTTVIVPLENKE